jgi:hypothetical protein
MEILKHANFIFAMSYATLINLQLEEIIQHTGEDGWVCPLRIFIPCPSVTVCINQLCVNHKLQVEEYSAHLT